MKTMKSYFKSMTMLLAVGALLASCDPDAENWSAGEMPAAGNIGVYISDKANNTVEVDPAGETSFEISFARPDSLAEEEATVNITVVQNDDSIFTVPATVTFGAGETEASVTVETDGFVPGDSYQLVIKLEDDNVNPYTDQLLSATYNFSALKWETYKEAGTGYLLDNGLIACLGWNVPSVLLQLKNITVAKTATDTRYRFDSPYCGVATDMDENGGYDFCPFNEDADISSTGHQYTITVTSQGAAFKGVCNLGMNWGHGEMSFNSQSRVAVKGDVITFPARSLAAFDNDGGAYTSASIVIYLTKQAYVAAMSAGSKEFAK